ncbi:MAG: cytochrome ubiquinol oxidase subunit I [Rhodothermales bacterium]
MYGPRSALPLPAAVRLHDHVSLPVSAPHNRAGRGDGRDRRDVSQDARPGLSGDGPVLDADLRRQFRDGGIHRDCDGVRVRDQLGRLFALRGGCLRVGARGRGVFAFFLESGFLAILLFGWDRVGPKMHFFATAMVFLGSVFSSIWIVVANSWMQTPAGFHVVGEGLTARAEITDFWAMVFNPSSVERLLHVWTGSLILGAFFVLSIAAWYLLHERHVDFARRTFRIALVLAAVSSLGALATGHFQADVTAHHQPAKLAALEGHFESGPAKLYLFGIPDVESATVRYGVGIPGGLSFLVHGRFDEPVQGLDQVAPADWPNVGLVFQTYHLMVALGMYFIALTLLALFFWWRGTLFVHRWLLWVFVFTVVGAYAANQAGWVSAEAGRQPWIVYGLLRTSDALSESVTGGMVLSSIVLFGLIYAMLFVVWIYVLHNKIQHGPEPVAELDTAPHADSLLDAAAHRTGSINT